MRNKCIPRTKGNSREGWERGGAQAGSTCYRVRCLAATLDCWGCGWHPGLHSHRGPIVSRRLSTPVGSTGIGSAPGCAHPSWAGGGWAQMWTHVHAYPSLSVQLTYRALVSTHKPNLPIQSSSHPRLVVTLAGSSLGLSFLSGYMGDNPPCWARFKGAKFWAHCGHLTVS